jgi:hypothetical protein
MPVIVAPEAIDVEVGEIQRLAWQNKLEKGFSTTDVALEFGLLTAEVDRKLARDARRGAHGAC